MRYVSTSNLSTRTLEWVPISANDAQRINGGEVATFSAADLASVYQRAEYESGRKVSNPPCPISGWRSVKCADL